MGLVVFGISYRTAPVELRERLVLDAEAQARALARIRAEGTFAEAALLCTCNRTELYLVTTASDPGAAARTLGAKLAGVERIDDDHGYVKHDEEAIRHALRVASSLDSLCVGERQIAGQLKDAFEAARRAGTLGTTLDRLFSAALHAAKRVHTETEIGAGAVSIASAGVVLAEKVLGTLAGRSVLVVGAGQTGALAARHLAERRPARLWIANRTAERAVALAAELDGTMARFDELGRLLGETDVAVCATSAPEPIVTRAMALAAASARRGLPLVLLDLGMPRNVDPRADEADDVFVYPINALQAVVALNMARRQRAAARAEAIVTDEAAQFAGWLRSLGLTPVVRELRDHFERARAAEVQRSLKHLPPEAREQVERLTRALVNKLLHAPTTRLKALDPGSAQTVSTIQALRELFALGGPDDESEGKHGR